MKHLVQNKKALSMALAAALAIAPVNAFAASNDVRGHWAERTITQWKDKGLIGGYQDGTFKPDKPATRAEFARIMNQALGLNHKGNVSFSDVSSSDWYYNDVAIAMGEQYTAGYPDGTFKPNEIITRAQAAVFIAKALGASGGSLASFNDASSIPAWAQGAVGGIVEKGYMSGYPDGTFRPNAVLTRAEAVSTLNRIMGVKPVEEETKKVEKDVVIDQSGTKLKDQTIEGNLTISDKVGNGKVTLSNVEIKGDLIIQGGGENSVYLDNTTVEGKTVMDKKNVRLELSGKTKLPNVEIKKACNLTASNFSGEVKRISITSSISDKTTIGVAAEKLYVESKADLYITKDIDQVVVEKDAAGTKIEVGSNSKVSTLAADGKISLNGKGKVSTLEANVDGITYASDITITKTETAKGVDKPEKTNKNGTGGGSSSDSSSSSKKSVSAIVVTGTAVVGAKLTATTTPTAATGTYQWQRCDTVNGTYTNITGATASTYTIASGDGGKYLRVVFSASGKYKGTQISTATAKIVVDTTAPVVTLGVANRTSDTAATVKFTSNEAGKYYTAVVDKDATAPTINTTGVGTACTTAETTVSVTLTAGDKDVYVVVKDAAGNVSTPVKIAVAAYVAPKEITGFTALTKVTLDADEHLVNLAVLKASGKLPTKVTVTDGTTPVDATITDWTGTFDGTATGPKTLTAVWTMPAGYVDAVAPISVTIAVDVDVVQTAAPDTTAPVVTPGVANRTSDTAATVKFTS
ncbi:S-layer homology domain-containing protein, partial [Anaerotignum propionicum]|uniref:S-layer homology domain-containing protein n=1 Tax=Anaerotignum propionicum TaxID=28446 RepID=UPI00210890F0|nr:S-layer homology domain-containing protein [Anaerotignum propionicum]